MTKKKPEEMDERYILYTLLADKVGAVDPKDVFYAKKIESGKNAGKYSAILGGKKITRNQASQLVQEALTITQMGIWKVFTETLKHEANLRMFKLAKTERDLDWGKSILHATGVLETIVESLKNLSQDEIA